MAQQPLISAVDLFCGAAGLSLGLKNSGINVVAGIDLDPACRYAFERNIGAKFIQSDVCDLRPQELLNLYDGASIRVLAGCAPCQPFSGYTTRRRIIDERWKLLLEFQRLVRDTRPDIVTLENVPRLLHLPIWHDFVLSLQMTGYFVAWGILDASFYGVPQIRKRLVLLASKLGDINLPRSRDKRSVTVKQAIGALPEISAGDHSRSDALHATRALTERNLARIKMSKPAGTWRDWPEELQAQCHRTERGRTYPSVYGRMAWDQPSPTITTQFYGFGNGRFGHPEQHRAISLREGAILQSFPRDFEFVPPTQKRISFREIGRLRGNAVPPKLAQAIGEAIVQHADSYAK